MFPPPKQGFCCGGFAARLMLQGLCCKAYAARLLLQVFCWMPFWRMTRHRRKPLGGGRFELPTNGLQNRGSDDD
jgi:hypothetical protein